MRIVVTGVTGQVGGALLVPLGRIGTVVPADRALLNLAEPEHIPAALDRLSPELIVNPAAYTAVDRAEDEPELAALVNAKAPGVMARWAARQKVPVVHFSTDYVLNGQGDKPWREDSATGPLSVYGASKLAGEEAIRDAAGSHLIVRTSWVYAPRGTNFLRTIARLARERRELRIVADQVGSPTSARVLADAVAALISPDRADLPRRFAGAGGILNIAAAGETTWHAFATAIVEGLRSRNVSLAVKSILPVRSEEFPTKAKRPHNSRLDLTRLRDVFGIVTPLWREALEPELDELAREMR
jgi:dTDP-4-dehydrorhamnose reductase